METAAPEASGSTQTPAMTSTVTHVILDLDGTLINTGDEKKHFTLNAARPLYLRAGISCRLTATTPVMKLSTMSVVSPPPSLPVWSAPWLAPSRRRRLPMRARRSKPMLSSSVKYVRCLLWSHVTEW